MGMDGNVIPGGAAQQRPEAGRAGGSSGAQWPLCASEVQTLSQVLEGHLS